MGDAGDERDRFLSVPASRYDYPVAILEAIRSRASSLSYKSKQKDKRAARQATTIARPATDLIHC